MGSVVVDHPVPILVVVLIGLVLWWAAGTRKSDHTLKAAFPEALNLFKGQDVQVDGVDVGKIQKIEYTDGQAVVDLGINEKDWPLRQGTTAFVRYGTTLGNGTRYVQLAPGRKGAELKEDAIIPASVNTPTTEFDQLFNTFDKRTRGDLQTFLTATGQTFEGRSKALGTGLQESAPALDETSGLLEDLGEDEHALRGLISNGDRATAVLGARRQEISNVVSVSSATFDEFARKAAGIRASLDRFAPTLQDIRGTLPRVDESVDRLDGLIDDLGPGARSLPALVRDSRPALSELSSAAPLATSTVKTLRRSSPEITRMLAQGQPFTEKVAKAFGGLAPSIACIRPYAPDIAGFFTHWTSWSKGYDNISHYARVNVTEGSSAVYKDYPAGIKSDEFLNTVGRGLKYAMPRPPGLGDGAPYFLPECGAGPKALDPGQDPED